jgi:protein tyrosine phosphatase (PTP) superfamily phosphohydrolase (DUF442 family)
MRYPAWATLLILAPLGCSERAGPSARSVPVEQAPGTRIELVGLHNIYRVTDKLYSGSSPEGDDGFRSLQSLGVRTIVSVDGARPDVERARRHGIRYVHVPIGYNGVTQPQAWRLAKAVRDLPGPVYIHCHHGKHRGPAAAAVVHLCLDDRCPVETAVNEMRRAGTDPRYTGLYAAPGQVHRPTPAELDALPSEFPEVTAVPGIARLMVEIDQTWERLQAVRAAGWRVPADHPDIGPAHEALQLREHYREAQRLPEASGRPDEFRRRLMDAEQAARDLELALRPGKDAQGIDATVAQKAFQRSAAACSRCHATYRDVSQAP